MGLKDERKIVKIREGKIQEHTVQLVKSIFGLIVIKVSIDFSVYIEWKLNQTRSNIWVV